jgi:aminopeptidase S
VIARLLLAGVLLGGCVAAPSGSTRSVSTTLHPTASASSLSAAPATVAPTASPSPTALSAEATLRGAVTAAGIRRHLAELQRIADANGGTRAAGTPGFDASVAFVVMQLEAAGYDVQRQAFRYASGGNVATSTNLLAERVGTGPEVVMIGAHLDSVMAGAGINDNGSGAMALLEIAIQLAALDAGRRTVRVAFWSAEEVSHDGSEAYLRGLPAQELARITAYLNLDIIGSANGVRFVYDEPGAVAGSAAIKDLLAGYFDAAGLAWEPVDLAGKSDHASFTAAGIPTGGLFGGGTEPKTEAQAARIGGVAGAPADPCIHRACDTIAGISDALLEELADAAAHAVVVLGDAGPAEGAQVTGEAAGPPA